MTHRWTEADIKRLTNLWAEGKSAREIAKGLGGLSRNAVIGKARRLGLKSHMKATRRKRPAAPPKPESNLQSAPAAKLEPPKSGPPKASLKGKLPEAKCAKADLQAQPSAGVIAPCEPKLCGGDIGAGDMGAGDLGAGNRGRRNVTADICRWPIGDPGQPGFHFCGCPTRGLEAGGGPYCEAHSLLAYQPLDRQPRQIQRRRKARQAPITVSLEAAD